MASVKLWYGPAGSGRAGLIDRTMLDHWGRAMLIVPSREHARRRAESLLAQSGRPGAWGRPVVTFQDFTAGIIRHSRFEGHRLSPLEQRMLIDRAVAGVKRGGLLAAVGASADTRGFVNHLQQAIARLKQATVEPAEFRERAARRSRSSPWDTVVADVYAEYQRMLLEDGALDLPGLYWVAALRCREARPASIAGIEALLLDGFDDFTPSEFRLIEAVAPHVEMIHFGLNIDLNPSLGDLYEPVRRTAERLRASFDASTATVESADPTTTVEYAARNLFLRDEPMKPGGLIENIELVECHTPVHEIETVARRIKGIIVEEGAAPSSVAVVYRSLGEEEETLRSVFREFGLPLRMERNPALDTAAAPRAALALLTAIDGWRRDDVLDAISGPPMAARDAAPRQTFAALARHARISGGAKQWESRVARLRARLLDEDSSDTRAIRRELENPIAECGALLGALEGLRRVAEGFPATGPVASYLEALDTVVADWTLSNVDALRGVLGDMHRWHAADSNPVPRRTFVRRLRDAFAACESDTEPTPAGVWCLEIESARHLRFDYVFLMAANDGQIPKPPLRNALFSDVDIEQLREAGIGIDGLDVHARREAILFQRVFEIPLKKLWICRHAIARNEQEQLESPFVGDLRRLLSIEWGAEENTEAPHPALVACPRDLRNAAFSGSTELKEWFPAVMACATAGTATETERYSDKPFGVHDGVLADPGLIARIARAYGADHVFSVQQIETYISCPFRFFTERVLGLGAAAADEDGFDPKVRGTILHEALESFHRAYATVPFSKLEVNPIPPELGEAVDKAFEHHAWKSANTPDGVARVEAARMKQALARYLAIEKSRKDARDWRPTHFETSFGRTGERPIEEPSRREPYALCLEAGEALLAGRIDRIDLIDGVARIVDYKSSVLPKAGDVADGTSLQLMVYSMAIEEYLMPGTRCAEAIFIRPGDGETREALGMKEGAKIPYAQRRESCLRALVGSLDGIRTGRFHPAAGKDACTFCPSHNICRRESARMERKGAVDG